MIINKEALKASTEQLRAELAERQAMNALLPPDPLPVRAPEIVRKTNRQALQRVIEVPDDELPEPDDNEDPLITALRGMQLMLDRIEILETKVAALEGKQ
jgi:hypothetical protein